MPIGGDLWKLGHRRTENQDCNECLPPLPSFAMRLIVTVDIPYCLISRFTYEYLHISIIFSSGYFLSFSIPFKIQSLFSFKALSNSFGSLISLLTFFLGTSNPAANPGLTFNFSHHAFKFGNSSISIPAHAAELTHPKLAMSAAN